MNHFFKNDFFQEKSALGERILLALDFNQSVGIGCMEFFVRARRRIIRMNFFYLDMEQVFFGKIVIDFGDIENDIADKGFVFS